jgi:translation initiation factor 3 subunit I
MFFFRCQVVIGGGQDAMNVTMTDRRAGKFEAKFFHKVNYTF